MTLDGDALISRNPATGEVLETFTLHAGPEVERRVGAAQAAQRQWARLGFAERRALLHRLAAALRADAARLARDITLEMGKPLAESEAEVEKCAWNCTYAADHAEHWLADEATPSAASESYVSYQPLGVVLAIMPWNFPLWQVLRFAAPTLMAGNAVLLKHAPNVTRCALNIEAVALHAGLPEGLLANVFVPVADVKGLIADDRVAAVTLTGSPRAGAAVAAQAGAALKKSVLELGGSDAFIVLADADVDAAVAAAVRGRFGNCGQICLAPKRFILVNSIADQFQRRFVRAVEQLRVGDPAERSTQMGPMARLDLLRELDGQVGASLAMGAQLLTGGKRLPGQGYFYSPTVLGSVTGEMSVAQEETFGPVAALMRVADADRALELANHSKFGLSSNLWTADVAKAKQMARRMEAGGVFINGVSASDPRLPVGGVKCSGYGRELALVGMREFVNVQTVWIGPTAYSAAVTPSD